MPVTPYVPTPECIQVSMDYRWNGQTVANVFHWDHGATVDHDALVDLGIAVRDWYDDTLKATQSEDVSLFQIVLTDLTTAFSESFVFTSALPIDGGVALPAAPANVSLAVSKRTAGRGRSARGRFFHVGVRSDYGANSVFDPTYANAIRDAYAALLIPADFADNTLVVLSKVTLGAPRAMGLMEPVTAITLVDLTVDGQRRRLPGRGT